MAGRASLTFLGVEDIILSGEPEVTYFVEKYSGFTPYATRVETVELEGAPPVFDSERFVMLPRSGDLVTDMYLKVTPPFAANTPVLSSAGTLMIKYVELYIGSTMVERLWGEYIEMKHDLEVPYSKQVALQTLTGKGVTGSLAQYTIPLPFSLLKNGLPLCAFKDDVKVNIVWYPSSVFTQPIVNTRAPFKATLSVEYTYLSENEVSYIKANPQLHLFEQVQKIDFFIQQGVNTTVCPLAFMNPVKEMFFVIQNDTARGYDYTVDGSGDQLQSLILFFNSTDRISAEVGTPLFLRNIQALEFHTRIPDRQFYMYSFSLDPQNDAPSGHVNFSRISNQSLKLILNPSAANRYISVWAVNYNFCYVAHDAAEVLFTNFES